jgi:hypothetical protein
LHSGAKAANFSYSFLLSPLLSASGFFLKQSPASGVAYARLMTSVSSCRLQIAPAGSLRLGIVCSDYEFFDFSEKICLKSSPPPVHHLYSAIHSPIGFVAGYFTLSPKYLRSKI